MPALAIGGAAAGLGLFAAIGRLVAHHRTARKMNAPAATILGRAYVATRDELAQCDRWSRAFAAQRKDRRYYEIVEDTIRQGFDYRYFVVEDAGGSVRAVQPFLLRDQDLLQG